jgi:hypothetical protein
MPGEMQAREKDDSRDSVGHAIDGRPCEYLKMRSEEHQEEEPEKLV